MGTSGFDVKVEVTVDGAGFDTPVETNIKCGGEIPSATLTFPTGRITANKLNKKDKIRVYVGLDEVPEYPTFTGHLDSSIFRYSSTIQLFGSLNRAKNQYVIVDDYDNYDGLEISQAIQKAFSEVTELAWMSSFFETTSPQVFVPEGLRFEKGISLYDLMKQFREFITTHAMYQHGDGFYCKSMPDPDVASPSYSLAYGDTLLNFEPESGDKDTFNYANVIGKDGVTGSYSNAQRALIDGFREMPTIQDNDILNAGESHSTARQNVLNSIFKKNPMTINSHLLHEAVPNQSVVEITGAPYGLSDNYLIKEKSVLVTEASFNVSCKVTTPMDILSTMLDQLLVTY